jgi:hypothetical protein
MWDTTAMTASVPRARLWETQRTARRLVEHEQRPILTRDLARIVGKITAMTRGIKGARRYLLYVQQELSSTVRRAGFTGKTCLTSRAVEALRWWAGNDPWVRNRAPIVPETRLLQSSVQSDAATETLGWGGTLTKPGDPRFQRGGSSRSKSAACTSTRSSFWDAGTPFGHSSRWLCRKQGGKTCSSVASSIS